jgi:vitamin B12/bleomycin/antimicrobial peptide transport system ATP-binding/permease protein
VTVRDATGRQLVGPVDLAMRPGEHLIVSAPSGGGKTSLVRAVAGLWPWGSGSIERQPDATLLVIPQRPYVPATSLRRALSYPSGAAAIEEARFAGALHRVGLSDLATRLDETVRWDHALSNGELQRLGIARILVQRPDLVILDEALGAVDEAARADLMRAIAEASPRTAVLSFTQAPPGDRAGIRHIALPLARARPTDTPAAPAPRIAEPV